MQIPFGVGLLLLAKKMKFANNYSLFLWAALALVPLMPNSDSIWIDEAQTWRYARQPAFAGWRAEMASDKNSESQMPLGMFSAWVGARFLGTSEWAMRAPNMLWAAGSIFIFYLLGRSFNQPFLPLLLAVQPYLWFYANEARPYALQIFCGAILLYSLYQVIQLKLRGEYLGSFFWRRGSSCLCQLNAGLILNDPCSAHSILLYPQRKVACHKGALGDRHVFYGDAFSTGIILRV